MPLWFHEKSVNLGGIEHLTFRCGTTVTGIGLENIMKTGPKRLFFPEVAESENSSDEFEEINFTVRFLGLSR